MLDDIPGAVGNQQQRGPLLFEVRDASIAFRLKTGVTHGERFIDDQNIRPGGRGDSERQAHLHPAGIDAYGLFNVVADIGEGFDLRH